MQGALRFGNTWEFNRLVDFISLQGSFCQDWRVELHYFLFIPTEFNALAFSAVWGWTWECINYRRSCTIILIPSSIHYFFDLWVAEFLLLLLLVGVPCSGSSSETPPPPSINSLYIFWSEVFIFGIVDTVKLFSNGLICWPLGIYLSFKSYLKFSWQYV